MSKGIKRIEYSKGIFDEYIKDTNLEHWCETFPELMWGLGFKMDCYESYLMLYPNNPSPNLSQKEIEDIILDNLNKCDISIVGNYIFSRFRELAHWCDYGYPEERANYFFPKAFEILISKFENSGFNLESLLFTENDSSGRHIQINFVSNADGTFSFNYEIVNNNFCSKGKGVVSKEFEHFVYRLHIHDNWENNYISNSKEANTVKWSLKQKISGMSIKIINGENEFPSAYDVLMMYIQSAILPIHGPLKNI